MSREQLLDEKRFSRWLLALMLAFGALGGVACEANVDSDGTEVEDGESEEEGDVDTDVDVDTDEQGGEGEEEEGDDE